MVTHWTRDRFGQVVFTSPGATPGPTMITYPFPFQGRIVGRLILPLDLTQGEAARIGRYIRALAVDWEPDPECGPAVTR